MIEPFIPFAKQSIDASDVEGVAKTLLSDIITRGPVVKEFEEAIATFCGASYAVAFNSGTSALAAAYFAAKTSANDRVITTPNSFIGSLVGAVHANATPVFIDIDRASGNIDLNLLELNINQKSTRGKEIITAVHFGGIAIDMKRLDKMIRLSETVVIEDAAHALGSCYPTGEKVGGCMASQMTVFSFHPNKQITTGEGGLVTTNDKELLNRLLMYRNNGVVRDPKRLWGYEVHEVTGNFNFTDFQAALGLSQLKKLDQFQSKRSNLMKAYREALQSIEGVRMLDPIFDEMTNYLFCTLQIDFEKYNTTRDSVMSALHEKNIGSQVFYIPLYRHPYFRSKMGPLEEYFPEMETFYKETLAIPFHVGVEGKDVKRVVSSLQTALKAK